ncbi:MAG: hypothetical protein ACJ8KU_03155 [Chthoniobacterales bacterium]
MNWFFDELTRRNVYKVAIGYAAVAWAALQAAALLAAINGEPPSLMEVLWTLAAVGFVIALVVAWSFELTPSGMKRTHNVGPHDPLPYWSRKKFRSFVVALVLIGFILLACHYVFLR